MAFPVEAGDWGKAWNAVSDNPLGALVWAVTHLAVRDLVKGKQTDAFGAAELVSEVAASSDESIAALLAILVDQEEQLVTKRSKKKVNGRVNKEGNVNDGGRLEKRPNKLRELREQYGIAQQAIIAQAQLATNAPTAIEKHNYYPGTQTRHKIVEALRVLAANPLISEQDIWPETEEEKTTNG